MKFSYKWLQKYFKESLPPINDLVEVLTFHAFEIEGVEDDLIDIDVLPNRSHDCLCYQGITKEISVLTGLTLKPLDDLYKKEPNLKSSDYLSLSIEDSQLVPRATKRLVKNVKIGSSPDWLKEKLISIGQKPINNVVDITNYVMWETGQPVHAFDFDKLVSNQNGIKEFIIRNAKQGEKIITLDNREFELDEDILVISDKEKALDIAGIKGGIVSGIDEHTQNIVLSVCNFNQVIIRRSSKKLGLRTDASLRFENGLSPEKVGEAMEKLSQLIAQITGGKISEDILEVYPRRANPYKVGVSVGEINKLLGANLSEKEIENIFNRLNFKFEKIKPIDKVLKLAPSFEGRPYKHGASVTYDAPSEFDCSSFTSYLFAQVGLAIPRISIDQYFFTEKILKEELKAGDLIFSNTGEGKIFYESMEFLRGQKEERGVDHVGLYLGNGKIIYASRYNENKGVMIKNLEGDKMFKNIIGCGRVSDNSERYVVVVPHERLDLRIKEDLIEEVGRVYGYKNIQSMPVVETFNFKINKTFYYINKIKKILVENGFSEVYTYTFGDKGEVAVQKPLASNLGFLRTNLSEGVQKSLDLNLKNASLLGLEEIKIFEIGKVFPSLEEEDLNFVIGIASLKKNGKDTYKVIENILEKLAIEFELEKDLSIFKAFETKSSLGITFYEIVLDELIEKLPEPESYEDVLHLEPNETIFKRISSYPFVLRDIAVWVDNGSSAEDLLNLIKNSANEFLVQTKLFDTYAPEGKEKTSYAFNLVFQSPEKTLTDEVVNNIMKKIAKAIENQGWAVR